jgi:hypothetical protein
MINKRVLTVKPIACYSNVWREIVKVMDKQLEHEKRPDKFVKVFKDINGIVNYLNDSIGK